MEIEQIFEHIPHIIAAIIALFAFLGAFMKIKAQYVPKYRYSFKYGETDNQSIMLNLYISRMEMNYKITAIKLESKSKEPIISCSINNQYVHNKYTAKFNKNKMIDLWDIIQPKTDELEKEILLEIEIPFSSQKNRRILIDFEIDKFPYSTFMVIRIPPKNHYVI